MSDGVVSAHLELQGQVELKLLHIHAKLVCYEMSGMSERELVPLRGLVLDGLAALEVKCADKMRAFLNRE